MPGFLIVNADDFGASTGINRAILDCHTRGIVTSASLMVTGRAVDEAVALSRDNPSLSIGLHWDVWGEDERGFDLDDHAAVRDEFERQLSGFERLMGRLPTHVDSHQHVHREPALRPLFSELVEPLGVPLRGDGGVAFVGGFYGQWEWMVTDLDHVSVDFLQWILREEVLHGWTEISCHPGYVSPSFSSVYAYEREVEVQTLCDPRIRRTIDELDIRLASYADYAAPRLRDGSVSR
jgi:chitin disaccharide deacetylase